MLNGSTFIRREIMIRIVRTKECSNYHTIAFISHASKVMLKFSKPGFSNT